MELHRDKILNYGFVVLSINGNIGRIKTTINSIKRNDKEKAFCTIVCNKNISTSDLQEIKSICPNSHKGKETITSLINKGMRKGCKEWNLFIIEGTVFRNGVIKKYARFIEKNTDILFPIVMEYDRDGRVINTHANFVDSVLNGLLIHGDTFKMVGNFGDNSLETEKILWATEAIKKGCKFKGVLGAKLI